jgi:glycosyltransferase involved in cell wall biosynthesis
MPQAVIVVPCHNEEDRLPVKEYLAFAENAIADILFVDDGSDDGTIDVIQELAMESERFQLFALPKNVGKAEAVRLGMLKALDQGAMLVAYLDADLSTPISEMERLLAAQARSGADVVLGARVGLLGWDIHRRVLRHYLGRAFATAASMVLKLRVYDTQCGAKVFRRTDVLQRALAHPFRSPWIFDVELLGRVLLERRKVGSVAGVFLEVPLQTWSDVGGSKLRRRSMIRAGFDLLCVRHDLRRWDRSSPDPQGDGAYRIGG